MSEVRTRNTGRWDTKCKEARDTGMEGVVVLKGIFCQAFPQVSCDSRKYEGPPLSERARCPPWCNLSTSSASYLYWHVYDCFISSHVYFI